MLTKVIEFCKTHMRYFAMALAMYAIVMTLGIFGDIGMGIGAVLAFACAAIKEIYDVKHGEKTSGFDIAAYMIGLIAGMMISGLGVIVA